MIKSGEESRVCPVQDDFLLLLIGRCPGLVGNIQIALMFLPQIVHGEDVEINA